MKFTVTMKDPDGFYDSVREAAEESLNDVSGINESESEGLIDSRHSELSEKLKKWFRYGEYLTVEIDTDEMTATVLTTD